VDSRLSDVERLVKQSAAEVEAARQLTLGAAAVCGVVCDRVATLLLADRSPGV